MKLNDAWAVARELDKESDREMARMMRKILLSKYREDALRHWPGGD